MDLNQLSTPGGNAPDMSGQLSGLTSSLSATLAPIMIASLVITVVFVVAYIISSIRRWKVQQAIFDIQKNVREINQRHQSTSPAPTITSPAINEMSAAAPRSSTESSDQSPLA